VPPEGKPKYFVRDTDVIPMKGRGLYARINQEKGKRKRSGLAEPAGNLL
jgi:hypothetical protein